MRIGSGAKLEFDRDRFRDALDRDFENVADLFGARQLAPKDPIEVAPGVTVRPTEDVFEIQGVAEQIKTLADSLTNSIDGFLTQKGRTLDSQIRLQEQRIVGIDEQLANKRTRLEAQFLAMERAIAQLQTQQSALASLG